MVSAIHIFLMLGAPILLLGTIFIVSYWVVYSKVLTPKMYRFKDKNGVILKNGDMVTFTDFISDEEDPSKGNVVKIVNSARVKLNEWGIILYDFGVKPSQVSEFYSQVLIGEDWRSFIKEHFEVEVK